MRWRTAHGWFHAVRVARRRSAAAASIIGIVISTSCVSYSFGENNPIALTVDGRKTTIYFANCESAPNIARLALPVPDQRFPSILTSPSSSTPGSIVPLEIERVGTSTALTTDNEEVARLLARFPRDVNASPYLSVGYKRDDGAIWASLEVSLSEVPVSSGPDQLTFVVRFADPDQVVDGPRTRVAPVGEAADLC